MTSVEWLIEEMYKCGLSKDIHPDNVLFKKAKEMHHQEIKKSWLSAWKDSMMNPLEDKYYEPQAEQYYNENYKNK